MHGLPSTGYLRLWQIIGRAATKAAPAVPPIIPVSRSTWWAGVKSGRFPSPVRALGGRITAWRVEDIRQLIEPPVAPVGLHSSGHTVEFDRSGASSKC